MTLNDFGVQDNSLIHVNVIPEWLYYIIINLLIMKALRPWK